MGFLTQPEIDVVLRLDSIESLLSAAVRVSESLHLQIRVLETSNLPRERLLATGALLDRELPGFVKFRLPGEINAIFSQKPTEEGDPFPCGFSSYLDHVGLDIREESASTRDVFEAIAGRAEAEDLAVISQGEGGSGVFGF